MTSTASKWLRVSTNGQTEDSQVPDLDVWSDSHDYASGPTFTVHGGSAHKGNKRFDAEWAKVLAAFEAGTVQVLLVWKLDRLDRKLNALGMIREITDLGGRVEFVTEPHLNDLSTMGGRIALKVAEEIAYQESVTRSDRVKANHNTIRSNGGVIGRPVFGYVTSGPKLNRQLTATEDGITYIPQIFKRVANGESLRTIALWLDSESVKPNSKQGVKWSDKSISQIIKNQTYVGRRTDSTGDVANTCEALVSQKVWDAANERLINSPNGQRGPRTAMPAMLKGVVTCGQCGGNCYRINSGYGVNRRAYYRCAGKAPQPKGCGAPMIRVDNLDEWVNFLMNLNDEHIFETRIIKGNDVEGRRNDLKAQIRALDMESADYDDNHAALVSDLRTLTVVADRRVTVDTGQTYAQRWDACPHDDARRAMLTDEGIRVTVTHNGVRHDVEVSGTVTS